MRIRKIELKDFHAFKGEYTFDLHAACNSLLVHGENGSGKSSLYLALVHFLDSAEIQADFAAHKNIFTAANDGYVKLTLDQPSGQDPDSGIYEWSPFASPLGKKVVADAAKASGRLDYKSLLRTYFIHQGKDKVNLFRFLVEGLLANFPNPATNRTFGAELKRMHNLLFTRLGKWIVSELDQLIDEFNAGWLTTINGLKAKAQQILAKFNYNLEIDLTASELDYVTPKKAFTGAEVLLTAKYSNLPLARHHEFLNEAKLSAIALSIYFAALLQLPVPKLRLMLLDDALIGLDMANRMPVVEILHEFFPDHQVLLTTYDRGWFEAVRQHTQGQGWKYMEMTCGRAGRHDLPVVQEADYLIQAKSKMDAGDFGGCANSTRKEFEKLVREFCAEHQLPVPFSEVPQAKTLWQVIKKAKVIATGASVVSAQLATDIELYRSIVLNTGSHDDSSPQFHQEARTAYNKVGDLRNVLGALSRPRGSPALVQA
ncbi:MAG: hypothetical protein DPW14_09655 [Planctomycetes bacterium]|nr:hypothetical protein [Planctomycetota bacterium]